MSYVMTAEEARAARPHLFGQTFVRDYPFAFDGSEARSALLDGEPVSRSLAAQHLEHLVEAYAVRWDAPSLGRLTDGSPCWQVFRRGAFRNQIEADEMVGVPIVVNHGFLPDTDYRSDLLAEPIGDLVYVEDDEIGLRTISLYRGDSPLADAAIKAMQSGDLTAYSLHADIRIAEPTGEEIEGIPVYELMVARLRECGPTQQPADEDAVIVSAGGVLLEDVRDDFEHWDAELRDARESREQVDRVHRCVRVLREARTRADRVWGYYRDRIASLDEFAEAEAECDRHEAWLRDAVTPEAYRGLIADLPPRISLQRRMLLDVRHRTLPQERW